VTIELREAGAADLPFLWQCLAMAAQEPSVEAAAAIPAVAKYLAGFPRRGDFGVVAEDGGQPVAAAWARLFAVDEHPFVHVDAATPEIAMAVREDWRGRGIGATLLAHLAGMAAEDGRWTGLCLSVREDNPAVRLYERCGYRRIPGSDLTNRAGSVSFGMVLRF
jgi:GNAT superfamily N-acetyltransferase